MSLNLATVWSSTWPCGGDGVSQHYLEPARYAAADADLTPDLLSAASARGLSPRRGRSWTVPTPYRTTVDELIAYREEGIATTELISAALFAVGVALGAQTASAVIITRVLGDSDHVVRNFRQPDAVFRLLEAAIASIQQSAEELQ
jgi:uridine phosphorylase